MSLRSLKKWIPAMGLELCAWMCNLALTPRALFNSFHRAYGPPNGTPILLVHGYVNCGTVWHYYRSKLAQANLGPIYTINLTHPFRSIEEYARQVQKKAEQITQETDTSSLILIGHSMGGLVNGCYAATLAPPHKKLVLISLGSPWNGTQLARLALGPNAKQMHPSSPFLCELRSQLDQMKNLPRYHVATKADQIVIPWESSIEGSSPERRLVVDDVGHLSLLYSKKGVDQVCRWIHQELQTP